LEKIASKETEVGDAARKIGRIDAVEDYAGLNAHETCRAEVPWANQNIEAPQLPSQGFRFREQNGHLQRKDVLTIQMVSHSSAVRRFLTIAQP